MLEKETEQFARELVEDYLMYNGCIPLTKANKAVELVIAALIDKGLGE